MGTSLGTTGAKVRAVGGGAMNAEGRVWDDVSVLARLRLAVGTTAPVSNADTRDDVLFKL
jgi:hypothetical protein